MVTKLKYGLSLAILLSFFIGCLGSTPAEKAAEANAAAAEILMNFFQLYQACVGSKIIYKNFIIDNIQAYLFYPAKTTVGYAPKFTSNRKFFANLIGTPQFHHMINNDLIDLKRSFIDKLKFCDDTVMDESMLSDLYDQEHIESANGK